MVDEPRFLCDEMLVGLAHWLRAAGYDTALVADGRADLFVAEQALNQERLLLTRDRQLAATFAAAGRVILLNGADLPAWADELSRRLALNWLLRPFSRCLVCNTLLQAAAPGQYELLPPRVRGERDVRYCPACDKLYWEGSHVRRMRTRLGQWQLLSSSQE